MQYFFCKIFIILNGDTRTHTHIHTFMHVTFFYISLWAHIHGRNWFLLSKNHMPVCFFWFSLFSNFQWRANFSEPICIFEISLHFKFHFLILNIQSIFQLKLPLTQSQSLLIPYANKATKVFVMNNWLITR